MSVIDDKLQEVKTLLDERTQCSKTSYIGLVTMKCKETIKEVESNSNGLSENELIEILDGIIKELEIMLTVG